MEIPHRLKREEMANYAGRLAHLYASSYSTTPRKQKGQFFTPKQVGEFMAGLFDINNTTTHLLDPGAGTGVLTAAFCERLIRRNKTINLTIDAYENDPNLLPLLEKTLEAIKREMGERGHAVHYNVHGKDFILENNGYFRRDLFWNAEDHDLYDFIISNPPYYKLRKDTPQSSAMMDLVSGQPNIYALFMALSASMLKPGGEMVFITPRSFCSGLYYKRFRNWFLENMELSNIHIFESRSTIFKSDEVLQENIIIKAKKSKGSQGKLTISVSPNKDFFKHRKIKLPASDVIFHNNRNNFIRIPTSLLDVEVLHIIDNWPCTLRDLGLEISTGPVVPFRAEKFLLPELVERPKSAPLLWMHNMKDMEVVWPLKKNNKAGAIKVCAESRPLLLPVRNYVLLKRFSSKEQRRRLYAAVFMEKGFPHDIVGIENHVNYIHRPKGNLTIQETFGIAALLNSRIIDNYFRSLNGNTQVNATEIRGLPLPNIEAVKEIGNAVYKSEVGGKEVDIDDIIASTVRIDEKVINLLREGEAVHEKD